MPIGNEGRRYAPALSVCVTDSIPVAWLVATTFVFTTTAPVASLTVPLRDAADWASMLVPNKAERATKRKGRKNTLWVPINLFATTSMYLLLLILERTWTVDPVSYRFAIPVPD